MTMLDKILQPKAPKSELAALLGLAAPTLEQLAQTEQLLQDIASQARAELAALDADEKARAADRLVGRDDGSEARTADRIKAQQRLDDASEAIQQARAKASALECRIQKEADDAAWAKVRKHLDDRRQAVEALDDLVLDVMARYRNVMEATDAAIKAAPVKPSGRGNSGWTNCAGRHPAEVGLAIMARMNSALGSPLNVLHASEDVLMTYQRAVSDGLGGFTRAVEVAILAPVNDV